MDYRFSVAPMMDWTDRHCRYFHRLLAPSARLYTEMVTTGAILHGDRDRLLGFNEAEHPVALQLGGSEPDELAECARVGVEWGYDEINLNVGCPSDRVQRGRFGACLMREPELVRDCVAAMRGAIDIPVTVKTRLGVDELHTGGLLRLSDRLAFDPTSDRGNDLAETDRVAATQRLRHHDERSVDPRAVRAVVVEDVPSALVADVRVMT